jgi:hypothetical protein
MNKLRPAEDYHSLSDGYNNGENKTIVPYEVILFNNGIICKKSPHPVVADHMKICRMERSIISHDNWPIGFNFITFHYIGADHEKRLDFIENIFTWKNNEKPEITYEACSDLKMKDGACPRFSTKEKAFKHCMKLMIKEFNILSATANDTNRCIKK